MENLKFVLGMRDASPQVQQLLDCLADPSFDLDVYICSVGGVGSTELSNFLTRHGLRCNLLQDQDSVRHAPTPSPRLGGARTRVIYLFGDPLAAAASHYRRGIAAQQAQKTAGAARPVAPPASFDEYVARGEDLFGFAAHLDNWLTAPVTYDIFYARYERLWDPPVALALMLHALGGAAAAPRSGGPAAAASGSGMVGAPGGRGTAGDHGGPGAPCAEALAEEWCGGKRQRASRVTKEQRRLMYVDLVKRMDALPPAFVRRAGGRALEAAAGSGPSAQPPAAGEGGA